MDENREINGCAMDRKSTEYRMGGKEYMRSRAQHFGKILNFSRMTEKKRSFQILIVFLAGPKEKNELEAWKLKNCALCIF